MNEEEWGHGVFVVNSREFAAVNMINVASFLTKISVGSADDCWEWQGAKDKFGYGRFHIGLSRNSAMLSHRVAYGLDTGESPEAVCHRCDNPKCCNPRHMFGGTRADNNRDMAEKGRAARVKPMLRGERHHQAKLTDTDAAEIRSIYREGSATQRQIAKRYGVSQRTINKVVRRISFRGDE